MKFKLPKPRLVAGLAIPIGVLTGAVLMETPVTPPEDYRPYPSSRPDSSKSTAEESPAPAIFEDVTLSAGLGFRHGQGEDELSGLDESLGSGACAFDYNGDGWTDLFLVNGSGHTRFYGKPHWWQESEGNALFRNVDGRRFENVTAAAGLSGPMWGMGCLTADFDNDGDPDLLVTGKGENRLYANEARGRFDNVTPASGITGGTWSTSAAAADFNGDGLLDLYVGNFVDFTKSTRTFEGDSQFSPERKPVFDASLYPAEPNRLYLNLGGLRFQDVATDAEVTNSEGRTLDVAWVDLNRDRRPDLLVSNERGTGSNVAYLNRDGRHFEPAGAALRLGAALGTRGIATGDLDGDLRSDLVIASAPGENNLALVQSGRDETLGFTDLARQNGIGASEFLHLSSWTVGVHDFNNDGDNDLFVAAGLLDPDADSPRVPQGQPKQLLLNVGGGRFQDGTAAAGVALADAQSARGAVFADFDNDGDVDIYVAHNNDLGQLLENRSPRQHWLGLRLRGTDSNRDAIGASVRVTAAGRSRMETVGSGEGFLSDGDRRLLFGLGEAAAVTSVRVEWPDGRVQEFGPVPADRYLEIVEGRETVADAPARVPEAPAAPVFDPKLAADRPELRARYLRLLTDSDRTDRHLAELAAALHDPAAGVRRAAIEIATAHPSPGGLSILVEGLGDPDPGNAIAAVEGLCQFEDEASVRWLLRALDRGEAPVKAALADCFGYFFREEEAVVHRKYLAIPALIRALDDADPTVRRAAARALASGERYRGLHALMAHLGDPEPAVRAEVARSLGLIRQREAVPALRNLLADGSQPAAVIAEALIALKRLADPDVGAALAAATSGGDSGQPVEILVQLLARKEDATVLDPAELQQAIRNAYLNAPPERLPEPRQTTALMQWIEVRSHFDGADTRSWLGKLAGDPRAPVREAALEHLWNLGGEGLESSLRKALRDPAPPIRQRAAEFLLSRPMLLKEADLRAILSDPELRALALETWSKGAPPGDTQPWSLLLGASGSPVSAGAKRAGAPETAVAVPASAICTHPDARIQAFCPLLIYQKSTRENCELASRLLLNPEAPQNLRKAVLDRYGEAFDPEAVNTLFAMAKLKRDPLRAAAIRKLLGIDTPALLDFARNLAQAPGEDPALRFEATEYLVKHAAPDERQRLLESP